MAKTDSRLAVSPPAGLFGPGKRLYAITPETSDTDWLLAQSRTVLHAGVAALQYRNKRLATRHEQAAALQALCREFATALIINDDWQLAMELGAAGVHLGRDDAQVAEVRKAFNGVIGATCHNSLAAAVEAQAAGADYVAFGSFFASPVKPNAVRAPLALLGEAKRVLHVPIVAIGGITLTNAADLCRAGADAVAVISAIFSAANAGAQAAAFNRILE